MVKTAGRSEFRSLREGACCTHTQELVSNCCFECECPGLGSDSRGIPFLHPNSASMSFKAWSWKTIASHMVAPIYNFCKSSADKSTAFKILSGQREHFKLPVSWSICRLKECSMKIHRFELASVSSVARPVARPIARSENFCQVLFQQPVLALAFLERSCKGKQMWEMQECRKRTMIAWFQREIARGFGCTFLFSFKHFACCSFSFTAEKMRGSIDL